MRDQSKDAAYFWQDSIDLAMLAFVYVAGCSSLRIAAFSAGSPKESNPIGLSTS